MMPAVVLGLLGCHVTFVFTAITIATGDASFAVVPDYYAKAVDYDERKSDLATSDELGWSAELSASKQADDRGVREVVVRLRDTQGEAVVGASIRVDAFHYARAAEPIAFELTELQPGRYVGQAPLIREGFWQFDLVADRDAVGGARSPQRFVSGFKQFVFAAEAAR